MTYSQPNPAEETTADIEPQQPDTAPSKNTHDSDADTETNDITQDEPAGRDTADDTEGGGTV